MTVRSLREAETGAAAGLAARAFHDDPLFRHLYPDPLRRPRQLATEFRAAIRWVYRPVGVADVTDAVDRLALWEPPGLSLSGWRQAALAANLLRAAGRRRFLPILRDYDAFDALRPTEPHGYLGLLAVAPEQQGRGIGSQLVRGGLERARRDGVPVYLETGSLQNVAFYSHLGFRELHRISLPSGGPTHWGLWWTPARD